MILICEGCEHGYAQYLKACPWCGAGAFVARMREPTVSTCDTECYRDYWLCKFKSVADGTQQDYQLFPGHPLDRTGLRRTLSRSRIVTFNGNAYDVPMIVAALCLDQSLSLEDQCLHLKQTNDEIIRSGLRSWELYKRWGIESPTWIDHIDLIEVAPGGGSLKMYGGKMHSKRLQDLPFDPSASIQLFDRPVLREYCGNDLDTTGDLYNAMSAQIALRVQMSEEYGVDLRSKSDAQIAEAVMKKVLPFKPDVPNVPMGTQFFYRPPPWLRFVNLPLLQLLARSPFTVNASGHVSMTDELANTNIHIGGSSYRMGSGGLHSTESGILHRSDAYYSLQDVDVASFYPSIILVTGIFPTQIGPEFQRIYREWFERRLAAKKAGDKKNANSLKTLLNGTFGKLANVWSIFYAPSEMIQVTITGQLALLMLIELLEMCNISVVSANTDGVLIKCPRHMEWLRDSIVSAWCKTTGFETEAVDYWLHAGRDVNNYVGLPLDPAAKPKLKGAYAPPEPGPSGWPNPTGEICVDAVVAYLRSGVPLANTIRSCADVRKFVHLRQVRGGGEWAPGAARNKSATQKEMREKIIGHGWRESMTKGQWIDTHTGQLCALADAYATCFDQSDPVYLGRAVRWYYARQDAGHIRYVDSGNKVPKSEGCRPLMELPDELPSDVDFNWYENESRSMLAEMGVMLT